jgi:hypothetical protein
LISVKVPFPGHVITIVGAYQVANEIWITSHLDQIATEYPSVTDYVHDTVAVNLPTIVAKHVERIFLTEARPLWQHRQQVSDYDYSVSDGWVDTESAEYLYIREYPWVFHPNLGWLQLVEGEVVRWLRSVGQAVMKVVSRLHSTYSTVHSPLAGTKYTGAPASLTSPLSTGFGCRSTSHKPQLSSAFFHGSSNAAK